MRSMVFMRYAGQTTVFLVRTSGVAFVMILAHAKQELWHSGHVVMMSSTAAQMSQMQR